MITTLDGAPYLRALEGLNDAQLPALVYSEAAVARLTAHFLETIAPLQPHAVLYAVKAGGFRRLLQVLVHAGVHGFDASSPAEAAYIRQAVSEDAPIYVTAPALTKEDMTLLRLLMPACVHVDSIPGLESALRYLPDVRLGVRVNPGVTESRSSMTAAGRPECRLGIPIQDLPRALFIAAEGGLSEIGLHFHVACEAASFDVHALAVMEVSRALARCTTPIPIIRHLDIGGGLAPPAWDFGTSNVDGAAWNTEALERAVAHFKDVHRHHLASDFRILFEPGDALVGPAAVLTAAVIERRRTARGQEHWILNTNINHFPFLLSDGDVPPVLWPPTAHHGKPVILSGNSCLAGDEIAMIRVDHDTNRVVFGSRGSYEFGRMTFFNGRLRPSVYFQDDAGRMTAERSDSLDDVSALWGATGAPSPHTWFTVDDVKMPGDSWPDAAMASSPSIVRRMIERHTAPGGTVLDPFAGFGTTLHVAADCGRIGMGLELNHERWLYASRSLSSPHRVIHGDSATVPLGTIPEADLLLTSPPHWVPDSNALSGYSGNAESYEIYLEHLIAILSRMALRIRPNGIIAIIAANFRYGTSSSIPFAFDLTSALMRHFAFIGEEIACFTVAEADAQDYGNHQYCLQFQKEPRS